MNGRTRNLVRACLLLCACTPAASRALAQAPSTPAARYAGAIEQELAAMGIEAHCATAQDGRDDCTWAGRSAPSKRDLTLHAVYSDATDTVYFYVERYLVLAPEAPRTQLVLRRLMELNWELLIGKFEWNPRTGEVRISAVLNTDSNFDRRAFRSIVHALDSIAVRYAGELRG